MDTLRIDFEPFVDEAARKYIVDGLDYHNIAATGLSAWFPANFVLRSPRGEILGGLLGQIWGAWLQVFTLWVAEPARGSGKGSALLEAAEAYAAERGCVGVMLETFDFQARPFYEARGYAVFGTLEGHPPGHAKYFLQKRL